MVETSRCWRSAAWFIWLLIPFYCSGVFRVREKAVIFFDIKKPTTYIFQSHLHSVWWPLKMYVDFSSERFSLCILFTFIKCGPAQYFIFIVASRPG